MTLDCITSGELGALPKVRHGFFSRLGGTSEGIYASLNAGFGSADDTQNVQANRQRVAQALGLVADRIQTVYQCHSATALVIEGMRADAPRADAMVTRVPGLAIGILTADCAPVLFADAAAGVIGAAHAGWRGAQAGILENTVALMEAQGAARTTIRACVGPCINQAAYEVGPEFRSQFVSANPDDARFFSTPRAGQRPHFDLPAYVVSRLQKAGLAAVECQAPCTYENESRFYSYRRSTHRNEPDYGRHISAILLAQR